MPHGPSCQSRRFPWSGAAWSEREVRAGLAISGPRPGAVPPVLCWVFGGAVGVRGRAEPIGSETARNGMESWRVWHLDSLPAWEPNSAETWR